MTDRKVKPTIYLAILNDGWIRSELAYGVHKMIMASDLPFVFEDPQITRGQPASDVRCRIVKRYLHTSCGFLIMIDNDESPFHDLVDIVKANKDVVGCPAITKQNGILQWQAYSAYEKEGKGYKSTDLDALVDPPDFLERDAVGSGCIIIKRRVLEGMKAPFVDVFNKDGERVRGYDLNFCRRVKEAGFKIFTTPKKRCEHFKCIGLSGFIDTVGKSNVATKTIIG